MWRRTDVSDGCCIVAAVRRRANPGLLILLTPLLWGASFPASKLALDHLPAFSFMAWTRTLGLVAIVALLPLLRRAGDSPRQPLRSAIGPGLLLGGLIFAGFTLQTEGLARTSATNAGFITSLYVVMTPVLGALVFGHAVSRTVWWSVLVSLAGLGLLSIRDLQEARVYPGDLLVLAGDVAWAGHIIAVGRLSPRYAPWLLSLTQIGVASALHLVAAAPVGLRPADALSGEVWPLLLVTGVLGTGVAFTIQVVGQRTLSSTRAVILLAGEALFAAVFSGLWLGERLAPHQWLGGALVLAAMVYSEVSARRSEAPVLDPAAP